MPSVPSSAEYKTAEELAVELDVSVWKVNRAAKELLLQRILLSGDSRRRFKPEDAERIRERLSASKR